VERFEVVLEVGSGEFFGRSKSWGSGTGCLIRYSGNTGIMATVHRYVGTIS